MGRGRLTEEEIKELKNNPYVIDVDDSRIVYSNEFKKLFMEEYCAGKKPTQIFMEQGFDVKALGSKRIERACARWRESYNAGTLGEGPYKRSRSAEMKMKMGAELELYRTLWEEELKAEGKKADTNVLCEAIREITHREEYGDCVTYLCKTLGIPEAVYEDRVGDDRYEREEEVL